MILKRMRLLLIVLISLMIAGAIYHYSQARRSILIHNTATSYLVQDGFYKPFLGAYFAIFRSDIKNVCINETNFNSDCLNILIIENTDNQPLLKNSKNNMLAIGSNLVLIDRQFLDLLLIASSYAEKSLVANYLFNGNGLSPFATSVLWAQQYTTIERDRRNGGDLYIDEANSVKLGLIGVTSMDENDLSPEALDLWRRSRGALTSTSITAVGLAVFLEHELAHLTITTSDRLLMRIKSTFQGGLRASLKLEEDLVDQRAFDQLGKFMAMLPSELPALEGTAIETSGLYANFLLFWHDGMYDFFQNLRPPLYAEDFFYEVKFKSCDLSDEALSIVNDQVFAMIPSLAQARLKPLPILSKKEFSELSELLNSASTHSHSAIRAMYVFSQLTKHISKYNENIDPDGWGLNATLITEARAGVGRLNDKGSNKVTAMETDLLLSRMAKIPGLVMEEGYLCPTKKCKLATYNGAQLEVISSNDRVLELRLTFLASSLNSNTMVSEIIKLVSEKMKTERAKFVSAASEITQSCAGSYELVNAQADGQIAIFEHLATPSVSYLALRYLNPR